MKKIWITDQAPAPVGPYSQAVEVNGLVYLSGQISIDPSNQEVFTGEVGEQARRVMENIQAVLKAAGLGMKDIFKTTIFLTDMKDFSKVNEIYGRYFKTDPPARSTIQVAALPKGVSVEVEVIAARP